MDHSGREDPKLSEVKAVLQRLQGLSTELEPAGLRPAKANPRLVRRIAPAIIVGAVAAILAVAYAFPNFKRLATPTPTGSPKPGNVSEQAATKRTPAVGPDGPSIVQAAAVSAPPAVGPSAQQVDPAKAGLARSALEAALALMTNGRVHAARQQLLAMTADGSPDVAWALARSYDPNFLVTLPATDAGPDIEEAARWYRTWYAAAVKQGLVADSVSLERIVGSMRQ